MRVWRTVGSTRAVRPDGRRREILRAREEFCRLFFDDAAPPDAARTLSKYFLSFALLARRSVEGGAQDSPS
jgi:hypothetical protein